MSLLTLWYAFLAICELAFLVGIIAIHFVPYDFSENTVKPFFKRHRIISGIFLGMCTIGCLYFIYSISIKKAIH